MSHFYPQRSQIPRLSRPPANTGRPDAKTTTTLNFLVTRSCCCTRRSTIDVRGAVRHGVDCASRAQEATHKMWEAHHCGQSVLLVTYRERAELIVELFAGKGLKVTIEPFSNGSSS